MSPALACRGLSKSFDGSPALLSVSWSIEVGEHLAVKGPSGSGKTTLLRLLAGLLEPSSGVVYEGERPVNAPGAAVPSHLRGIGMVFQGLALWPHMKVREQVEFSLVGRFSGSRRERRRTVDETIHEAELDRLAGRYPAELSGGEKQRVAWARAVAARPCLLLLDEPLTSLDPRLREELLSLVVRYGETPGRTLVVVTHDPPVAARVGRRIIALEPA